MERAASQAIIAAVAADLNPAAVQPSRRAVLQPVASGVRREVEIKTIAQAVALLDEWRAEARDRLRLIVKLQDEIFWANHRADVHRFTEELLRWQLRDAGITPADEVKASVEVAP